MAMSDGTGRGGVEVGGGGQRECGGGCVGLGRGGRGEIRDGGKRQKRDRNKRVDEERMSLPWRTGEASPSRKSFPFMTKPKGGGARKGLHQCNILSNRTMCMDDTFIV